MSLQGLIDLDAEIAKCEKKLDLAKLSADKMRKVMAQPGYEQNIPEDVRANNLETVRSLLLDHSGLELPLLTGYINSYKPMRLK